MTDPLTITLITTIITVAGGILLKLHITRCKSLCCESDCRKRRDSKSTSSLEEPDPNIKISEV
jgi:hypothetical protein